VTDVGVIGHPVARLFEESVSKGGKGSVVISADLQIGDMNPEERLHSPVQLAPLARPVRLDQTYVVIEGLLLARRHDPQRVFSL
jgi:hypothetical protein